MARQAFYFSDGPYLQAMQGLHAALSGSEAFVKFIGQPRTGKSGVCEKLAQFMQLKGYRVIYFDYPVESPEMLRSMLAKKLDMPGTVNILRHLEDALSAETDKPLVILFDDAHLLSDITLIDIYRLASVQVQQKRVINIVLCGEPELERRLSSKREFKSLLHHVSHNFLLEPMNAETTGHFLVAFLAMKGQPGLQLEPSAVKQFYKSCRGFPGPAYSLCERILSIRQGSQELDPISKEELLLAIRGADGEHRHWGSKSKVASRWMLFTPIVAVFIIASLALLLRQLNPAEPQDDTAQSLRVAALNPAQGATLPLNASPFAEDEIRAASLPAATAPQGEDLVAAAAAGQSLDAAPMEELVQEQAEIEVDVPVSDSNLSLVTAQERGISDEVMTEPLFEQLEPDASAATASAEPALSVIDESAATGSDVVQLSNVTLTRPMLALDEEEIVIAQAAELEPAEPASGVVAAPASERVSPPVTSSDASNALGPQQLIQSWLDAWQEKDLESYFASYDESFEPRYHNSKAAWVRNRERVIGSASQISLAMTDFELVSEDAETIEVHFWLAYRSPSYKDDTRKKMILRKLPVDERGVTRLVILEEINLQVRV